MVAKVGLEPLYDGSYNIAEIRTSEKEEQLKFEQPTLEQAQENKITNAKNVADKQKTIIFDSVVGASVDFHMETDAKAVRELELLKEPLIIEDITEDYSSENNEQKGFKSKHATKSNSLKQVVNIKTNYTSSQARNETFGPRKTEEVNVTKVPHEAIGTRSTSIAQQQQHINKDKSKQIQIYPTNVEAEINYPNSEETIAISANIFANNKKKKISPECVPVQDFSYVSEESVSISHQQLKDDIRKATKIITENYKIGMSISEVPKLLNTEQAELMKKPEAQVALLNLAERLGNAPLIHKTIVNEISKNLETTQTFGMKALFVALQENEALTQDIVVSFEPEDFDKSKVKATLCQILNEAYEVGTNLPQVCSSSH